MDARRRMRSWCFQFSIIKEICVIKAIMGLYAHIHHESLTMYRHCIATNYRAKYRKPTQEPNLGGL